MMIELARRAEFEYVDESLLVRGVSEGSRGKSLGVVRGRKQIFDEYDGLYRRFTPKTKAVTRADTCALEGRLGRRQSSCSATTIVAC